MKIQDSIKDDGHKRTILKDTFCENSNQQCTLFCSCDIIKRIIAEKPIFLGCQTKTIYILFKFLTLIHGEEVVVIWKQKIQGSNVVIILYVMTDNNISAKKFHFDPQLSQNDIYYEQQDLEIQNHEKKVQISIQKEQEHLPTPSYDMNSRNSSSDSKKLTGKKKNLNHNFQKHAVVTIKKLMKINYDTNPTHEQKIAHEMWNTFMITNNKSKKQLVILFGLADMSDEKNKRLFVKCGFQRIIVYEENYIRKAQQFLRKRCIQTVTEQAVQMNIQNFRNIRASQQFLIYFYELLKLIREGPLLRLRINNKFGKTQRLRSSVKRH